MKFTFRRILGIIWLFVLSSWLRRSCRVAQSFEASVHFASSQWSEFDGNDLGLGGRLTWKPSSMIGVDADLTWYPSDFLRTASPFSGSRFEGLVRRDRRSAARIASARSRKPPRDS